MSQPLMGGGVLVSDCLKYLDIGVCLQLYMCTSVIT